MHGATGVGDGHWYRFSGVSGDALPLQPVGRYHCGTIRTGWLSGWNSGGGAGTAPRTYNTPGRYPVVQEGVVEMAACFENDSNCQCYIATAVGVVMCDGFLLWRLPYAPDCDSGRM